MIAKWQNITSYNIMLYIILCFFFLPTFYLPFKLFIITHSSLTTLVIKFAQYFTTFGSEYCESSPYSLSPTSSPTFICVSIFVYFTFTFFYLHDGIFFCFSDIIDYTFLLFFSFHEYFMSLPLTHLCIFFILSTVLFV